MALALKYREQQGGGVGGGKEDRRDHVWKKEDGITLPHLTRQVNRELFFFLSQSVQLQCRSLWNCPCGSAPGTHSTMVGEMDEEEQTRDVRTVEVKAWVGWQSEQNLSGAGAAWQTAWHL